MSYNDADYKEALQEPLLRRLTHEIWKIRADAFDELVNEYKSQANGKSPIFNETGVFFEVNVIHKPASVWKSVFTDKIVVAKEKGLTALLVFLDRCSFANKYA